MTTERPRRAELDEILSRAVDRQLAEQRALREALEDLREAVRSLGDRPQPPSSVVASPEDERWRRELGSGLGRIEDELRDMRSTIDPQAEVVATVGHAVGALRDELSSMREDLGGVGGDIEDVATALVDLNSGLRKWAGDVDRSVEELKSIVSELEQEEPSVDEDGQQEPDEADPSDQSDDGSRDERLDAIGEQVKETAELSLYLSDQIEDLDRIIGRLGSLPENLEGVVSQAMRRTLTTKAKLDKEAETLLDDAFSSLAEDLDRLAGILSTFEEGEVRKLTLSQVEMTSRLESLHELIADRLSAMESGQHEALTDLVEAVDRLASGEAAEARKAVAKTSSRKSKAKPKAKKAKKAKPKASKKKTESRSGSSKGRSRKSGSTKPSDESN